MTRQASRLTHNDPSSIENTIHPMGTSLKSITSNYSNYSNSHPSNHNSGRGTTMGPPMMNLVSVDTSQQQYPHQIPVNNYNQLPGQINPGINQLGGNRLGLPPGVTAPTNTPNISPSVWNKPQEHKKALQASFRKVMFINRLFFNDKVNNYDN